MLILKGSKVGPFLEAWYPLLIMSAAIICVFMNSSFSSVPRRFTYAILAPTRAALLRLSGLHNKTSIKPHVFVYAVPNLPFSFKKQKNIPSHLGAQKAEKHTWSRLSPAFQSCPLEEDSGKPFIAGSRLTNLTKTKPCRVTQNSLEN